MTILLLVLLIVLPLDEGGAGNSGTFVTQSLVFLVLIWAWLRCAQHGRLRMRAGWEALAGLGLLAVALLSFSRVDYWFGPFLSLWSLIVALLLAATMLWLDDAAGPIRKYAPAVVAVSSALQAASVFVLEAPPNLTPSGTFVNANHLAAYLVIGSLLALGIAAGPWIDPTRRRASNWPARCAGLFIFVVDVAALFRVGARGALVSLLAACAIGIAIRVPPERRRLRIALWSALVLVTLIAAAAIADRFQRLEDPYKFDRLVIWRVGLSAAADHPVLGMGPGMFQRRGFAHNLPLDREMFRYSKTPGSTHSTYLQVLVETGGLGLVSIIVLVALLLRRLWHLRSGPHWPAAAAVFACLVHGLVDMPFDAPAVTLSLIVLIVPALVPGRQADASLACGWSFSENRSRAAGLAVLGTIGFVYVTCVLLPYAAHRTFLEGAQRSRPGQPAALLDRAVDLGPYNPLYRATRAELRWDRSRPLEPGILAAVHHDLIDAHRLDPGDPAHLLDLARLHARACFELGPDAASVDRAIGFYHQALALGRKDPRPRLELATFLFWVGRMDEGLGQLDEALELEPRFLSARLARVRALLESGFEGPARQEMERFSRARDELEGYAPRNGYEEDLVKVNPAALAEIQRMLG